MGHGLVLLFDMGSRWSMDLLLAFFLWLERMSQLLLGKGWVGKSDEDQEDKDKRKERKDNAMKRNIYKKKGEYWSKQDSSEECGSDLFILFSHGKGLNMQTQRRG